MAYCSYNHTFSSTISGLQSSILCLERVLWIQINYLQPEMQSISTVDELTFRQWLGHHYIMFLWILYSGDGSWVIKDTFLYNQHRIVHQVIYSTSSDVSARQDVDQGFVLAGNMVFPVLVLA